MKTKLIVLIAILSSSMAFSGTNLIRSGGFEVANLADLRDSSWITDANVKLEGTNIITGAKSIRFASVNSGSYLSYDVAVEEGETYVLTFTGRIHDAVGTSGSATTKAGTLYGRVRAGTSAGAWTTLMDTQSNEDTTMSAEYTVPAGLSTVRVQMFKNAKIGYIDDVIFEKKSDIVTTISGINNESLKIYSPSQGELILTGNKIIKSYTIYSIDGQIEKQGQSNTREVNINSISRGIYVVKAIDALNKNYTKKIIIK